MNTKIKGGTEIRSNAEDEAEPALAVRDLWAGYDGKPVLEAINFQVDRRVLVNRGAKRAASYARCACNRTLISVSQA